MLFDTPVYFLFLLIVVVVYWRLGRRNQNRFLLVASYFFYGWWDWRFLLLMAGSTLIDYRIALRVAAAPLHSRKRKRWLIASLAINFGLLALFKYFGFFTESLFAAMHIAGAGPLTIHFLEIVLPPGISFYTFQEVAYMVDVYRQRIQPSRSLVDYGLFISLFPHLIAGPIQRPDHLLPQVERERERDPTAFFDGCMLIISGLFRKCVIANQCAVIANGAFNGQLGRGFLPTVFGAYAFAWQIYGDFSGYSDIARGSAQLLGFHFMVNFRQPYLATSFQDFWRRWHISLSTWLRDYLYIPLGGSRRRTYRNLMLTMLLGGLWHGANWTYVIWGGLHGAALSVERAAAQRWGSRLLIFSAVCIAWVFFRASSLAQAFALLRDLGRWEWKPWYPALMLVLAGISGTMLLIDWRLERAGEEYLFQHQTEKRRIMAALFLLVGVMLFAASQSSGFLYFRF